MHAYTHLLRGALLMLVLHALKSPGDHLRCLKNLFLNLRGHMFAYALNIFTHIKSDILIFPLSLYIFFQTVLYSVQKVYLDFWFVFLVVFPTIISVMSHLCGDLSVLCMSSFLQKAAIHPRWRFVEMAWVSLASTSTMKASWLRYWSMFKIA